jgi:2,3-dihydroxybenzoate decarboxylase
MTRGTIAIEEAIINPASTHTLKQWMGILSPGSTDAALAAHERKLLDIHGERLTTMDKEGVEYMLLSLTSPGCQGEHDIAVAEKMARAANDYLAAEGECLASTLHLSPFSYRC